MHSTESLPLNAEYSERDIDDVDVERTNKVHRLRSGRPYRASGPKNAQFRSDRPSIARRIVRTVGRFSVVALLGVGATLAWQSYGGEMVKAWAPSLGWLFPTSPSTELQALLKPVALDLAIMKRSVEQLASNQDQLARKQDQMMQAFTALQAAERDISQNILALAPPAPKAANVPPSKPLQPTAR
jgi:hypothetical protein